MCISFLYVFFLVIENALCSQKLRLQLTPKLLSRSGLV